MSLINMSTLNNSISYYQPNIVGMQKGKKYNTHKKKIKHKKDNKIANS